MIVRIPTKPWCRQGEDALEGIGGLRIHCLRAQVGCNQVQRTPVRNKGIEVQFPQGRRTCEINQLGIVWVRGRADDLLQLLERVKRRELRIVALVEEEIRTDP